MKLIRTPQGELAPQRAPGRRWKVLVVDDEPDVHAITRLSLASFTFDGRELELLNAMSASEARAILEHQEDIAVALIDVVMESEDAGLQLVNHIRNERGDSAIRLIIRTGQPGVAPERKVIDEYDIDDYRDKGELTAQRLYTSMRSALKAYRDLQTIMSNRHGLELILDVTPSLYQHSCQDMAAFSRGVLEQVTSLCRLSGGSLISSIHGFVTTLDREAQVRATIGRFEQPKTGIIEARRIEAICTQAIMNRESPEGLVFDSIVMPLETQGQVIGYIYLEGLHDLSQEDRRLIHVLSNQTAGALSNLSLQAELIEANRQSLHMLAVASEYKDEDTGQHINRMSNLVFLLCLELGLPEETAHQFSDAAILHDVGKLGVPDALLQKPGRLTPAEFEVVKHHASIGEEILKMNQWLGLARECAASHHEHWDGGGYPRGIKGNAIPLIGRIVAVADVYDALTHSRPYKEPWSKQAACAEIQKGRGSHFDPQVADAFARLAELEDKSGPLSSESQ